MATSRSQRIGIWVITGALVIGTLGSFAVLILAPKNQAADTARIEQLQKDYQNAVEAQRKELSDKYYPIFRPYKDKAAAFDAASITELKTQDLVVGDGDEIKADSSYSAYYIGWNPSGKIFDGGSSFSGDSLSAPLAVSGNTGLIDGWSKGVVGMKVGGIRQIVIPSDLAYKDQKKSDDIPPNTPLTFIVFIIPTPQQVSIPPELLKYYTTGSL